MPSERQHVKTVPTDDVDDSKVVEDVHVPSKSASIIEDKLVRTHRLLMKSTCLLIVPVMT